MGKAYFLLALCHPHPLTRKAGSESGSGSGYESKPKCTDPQHCFQTFLLVEGRATKKICSNLTLLSSSLKRLGHKMNIFLRPGWLNLYFQKMRNWVSIFRLPCWGEILSYKILLASMKSQNFWRLSYSGFPFSVVDWFSAMSTPHWMHENHPRFNVHKCHTLLSEPFSWSQAASGIIFNVIGVFLNVATSSLKRTLKWFLELVTIFREATEKSVLNFSTIKKAMKKYKNYQRTYKKYWLN